MADESSKRQVAFKVRVSDLVKNRYMKEDGWLPNYIAIGDKKVSRANVLGVIVSKLQESGQGYILDDGSGRIALRFFDAQVPLDVGDIVCVIGRPREFGADRYIVPEVIRKVSDSRWIEVRKLELALQKSLPEVKIQSEDGLIVEEEELAESNPLTRIMELIRENDSGEGVTVEELSVKAKDFDVDSYVKKLLEHGDIFEIRPGKYKVLE